MGRIFSKKVKAKIPVENDAGGVPSRERGHGHEGMQNGGKTQCPGAGPSNDRDSQRPLWATAPDAESAIPMPIGGLTHPHGHLQVFDDSLLQTSVRQGRRMLLGSAFMIGAGVIAALAGAAYVFTQNADRFSRVPYVFFEVKAIDAEGHPVAGAKVKMSNHPMGVTDSFGEWRQFLRLKLGSSMTLSLDKTSQKGEIFASKNLVIPLRRPANGEVEMRQIIQMFPKDSESTPNRVAATSEETTLRAEGATETPKDAPETLTMAEKNDDAFAYNRVRVAIDMQAINKQTNPTGFERQNYLATQIAPQLKQLFIKSGLAIDSESPWKINVKHISAGDGQSLIMVETLAPGDAAPASFLRNYTTDPKLVAEQIFGLVRYHTNRSYQILREDKEWYAIQPAVAKNYWRLTEQDVLIGPKGETIPLKAAPALANFERVKLAVSNDPCTDHLDAAGQCYLTRATIKHHAPREGLTKQRLRYRLESGAQLYVLGFAALPAGTDLLEYWAKSGEKANVTLVEHGRVTLRAGLVNFTGRIATLAKPVETVAHR